MAEKNGTFLEVKKLGCFWFNHVRGTAESAPAAQEKDFYV